VTSSALPSRARASARRTAVGEGVGSGKSVMSANYAVTVSPIPIAPCGDAKTDALYA
jgi:hypothetical protein